MLQKSFIISTYKVGRGTGKTDNGPRQPICHHRKPMNRNNLALNTLPDSASPSSPLTLPLSIICINRTPDKKKVSDAQSMEDMSDASVSPWGASTTAWMMALRNG